MSVERHRGKWRVRWRDGTRNRARTFDLKKDALAWDAEARRRRQMGTLSSLDAGTESLDEFFVETWAPTYAVDLAPKTRKHYASLYDRHIGPFLGSTQLRALTPQVVARWQADRLAAGAGRVALRHAFELLGSILQRAYESERIVVNPTRQVRKARRPEREEVRPLAPPTIERMRAHLLANGSENPMRDATLISILAYAGLRPGETLALRWGDVRTKTILVQRAVSLGEEKATKTSQNRTVRLLGPLKADLAEWRLAAGRPSDDALVFPAATGEAWTEPAYQSWRRRAFKRALTAADIDKARPYDLRHSFASLLLHEGRSVIYVARQLGHDARLTLTKYGHVIDELDDAPRIDAETAIRQAREALAVPPQYPSVADAGQLAFL